MRFEFLPAFKGDCFLIHAGTDAEPFLILVDGGPAGTYDQHLRPHLMKLRDERGLNSGEPLVIDLVIVSHVDDDHINGILGLFREIRQTAMANDPPLFEVRGLWHNSFDEIVGNDEVTAASVQFGTASLTEAMEQPETDQQFDAGMILQSIAQGNELRDLATSLELNLEINESFDGLIKTSPGAKNTREIGGITFTIVGPRSDELADLQAKHDDWLDEQREKGNEITPGSMLQSMTDDSVPNLSSIVLIADDGQRTALLTGDARGDYILKGLEETGEIAAGGNLEVDLLKMPHHGSDRNVDVVFLSRVTAPKYLFSGNGEHGNPERETFEMLCEARPDADMQLYLTYSVGEIDQEREIVHANERRKEIDRKQSGRSRKEPRPEWSAAEHSVGDYIQTLPATVKVIEPGVPVIDPFA